MADEQPLARFLDPWTLVYERTYPHPIERVFEAVGTGEGLSAWLIKGCTVERKRGGACSFTWGGPPSPCHAGTVTHFDPPHLIRYTLREWPQDPPQYLQFELEATAEGTRVRFTHAFVPGSPNPWKASFTAGWHGSMGSLRAFLDGTWSGAYKDASRLARQGAHARSMPIYGELIRTQWPVQHLRRDGDARYDAVEAYLSAVIMRTEDALATLRRYLAADVVHESPAGPVKGPDAVLQAVIDPELAEAFVDLLSTEITGTPETGAATAKLRMPNRRPVVPFIGCDYTFELRDERLTRIVPKLVFGIEGHADGE